MSTLNNLYSTAAIADRVTDIAQAINRDFENAEVIHAVVTLNGAFIFAADLVRKLKIPMQVYFAGASSYTGTQQGDLALNLDSLPRSFGNQPVLIIEDIMDSGNTVAQLRTCIAERFSGSIKVAALLKRQSGKGHADYYGFTVPRGLFVVGYGMDMDGRYRELSDVRSLASAVMSCDAEQAVC